MRFTSALLSARGMGLVIGRSSLTIATSVRKGWRRKINGGKALVSDERFFDDSGVLRPAALRNAMARLDTELQRFKPGYVQVGIADPAVAYYSAEHGKRISLDDADALARWSLGKVKGAGAAEAYNFESQVWGNARDGWRQVTTAVEISLLSMLENELAKVPLTIIDSVASFVWNGIEPEIRGKPGALVRLGPGYWTMQVWESGMLPRLTKSFWRNDKEDGETIARDFVRTLRLSPGEESSPEYTVYVHEGENASKALLRAIDGYIKGGVTVTSYRPRLRLKEVATQVDTAAGDVSWPR